MSNEISEKENEAKDIDCNILLAGPRYIYIVHLINTNYYKIGIADSIERRLKTLQTANPHELKLIYSKSFPDFFSIETYIHNFFCKKNVRGEWFELFNEDIYEIIFFLKRLESSKDINGEIKKRLRLQKKHKKNLEAIQKKGTSKIKKNSKIIRITPKIMMNKKTGEFRVYFRIKNPETNLVKMFVFKGGVNREKNLDLHKIKAEKLREKVSRLLENGLNPFFDSEEFKNITV